MRLREALPGRRTVFKLSSGFFWFKLEIQKELQLPGGRAPPPARPAPAAGGSAAGGGKAPSDFARAGAAAGRWSSPGSGC